MKNYILTGAILGASFVFVKGLSMPARDLSTIEHIFASAVLGLTLGSAIGAVLGFATGLLLRWQERRRLRVPGKSQTGLTSRR